MKVRKSIRWLTACGLAVLAVACQPAAQPSVADQGVEAAPQPKYGGVLVSSLTSDPPSFDAQQEATTETVFTTSPAYDRLLQFDDQDDSKVVPDWAERWERSADGNTPHVLPEERGQIPRWQPVHRRRCEVQLGPSPQSSRGRGEPA